MKEILKLIGGLLGGICIGLLIAFVGLAVFKGITLEEYMDKLVGIGLDELVLVPLLCMVVFGFVLLLQIVIHEGGHLVCGLASGYRFVSFRILSFTIIRKEGKLRIKRFDLAGTGGQCLLSPPDRPLEEIPTTLYNLGGVLANLLTVPLALLPLLVMDEMPFALRLFLLANCLVGGLLALVNGIPCRLGGMSNDGNNLLVMRKNPESKRLLVSILRVNAAVQEGMRIKDMPAEWFEVGSPMNYADPLQCNLLNMYIGRLMDEDDLESAYTELEKVLAHRKETIGLFVKEAECEVLFIALVTGRKERAEALAADKTLMAYINQGAKVMSSKERVLWALARYRDNDEAKAQAIYNKVNDRREQYLMQGEVALDLALMQRAYENE